ncbi:hypothetical protein RvY_01577 [Ramazzottius varieornatus]|uniref:Uncharacterized protein n=1 Tax=Ramazzottius varieornatus TaxID=947166 RepID=A0A1D1URJ2_RAMVA|nr:hypothetical protein RvY_01577 [Ramazzottius varieornatus]
MGKVFRSFFVVAQSTTSLVGSSTTEELLRVDRVPVPTSTKPAGVNLQRCGSFLQCDSTLPRLSHRTRRREDDWLPSNLRHQLR